MRRLAGMVLLCALLLRFMIPAGFMPTITAQGFAVTICTGQGSFVVDLDQKGQKAPDGPAPDARSQHPCAFAGMASVALVPTGRLIVVPLATYHPPHPAPAYLAPSLGPAAPPPDPTGPPTFA